MRHMPGPESVKIRLTYRTSNTRTSSKRNRQVWSPLTCNKLIPVQSSNPEEGKGGTTSCWKGKQKGHQGVIPHLFTKVIVDYLCCIPEQFHITKLSSSETGSRTLHYQVLLNVQSGVAVFFPWHPGYYHIKTFPIHHKRLC